MLEELQSRLKQSSGLEEKLDALRRFIRETREPWIRSFLEDSSKLPEIMRQNTALAEASLVAARELAAEELRKTYGLPSHQNQFAQYQKASFAIIGMGKLGSRELHFHSDLDVLFIFDRNGETMSGKKIGNQEYYAKLAQRLISYLSLHTREGSAYKVDTELRPSGNAGVLVSPLDPWTRYYHEHAALWERQALLKARVVNAEGNFGEEFSQLFHRLIFLKPFPPELAQEMHRLRQRIEVELAKETATRRHFKKGYGGLLDIEFAVQFLQLKLGKVYKDLVVGNTLEALALLAGRGVISPEIHGRLEQAYRFYRRLEFLLELKFKVTDPYLDFEGDYLPELAERFSLSNAKDFVDAYEEMRNSVRRIYLEILKLGEAA